jgi:hypothetical protein
MNASSSLTTPDWTLTKRPAAWVFSHLATIDYLMTAIPLIINF